MTSKYNTYIAFVLNVKLTFDIVESRWVALNVSGTDLSWLQLSNFGSQSAEPVQEKRLIQ